MCLGKCDPRRSSHSALNDGTAEVLHTPMHTDYRGARKPQFRSAAAC